MDSAAQRGTDVSGRDRRSHNVESTSVENMVGKQTNPNQSLLLSHEAEDMINEEMDNLGGGSAVAAQINLSG